VLAKNWTLGLVYIYGRFVLRNSAVLQLFDFGGLRLGLWLFTSTVRCSGTAQYAKADPGSFVRELFVAVLHSVITWRCCAVSMTLPLSVDFVPPFALKDSDSSLSLLLATHISLPYRLRREAQIVSKHMLLESDCILVR